MEVLTETTSLEETFEAMNPEHQPTALLCDDVGADVGSSNASGMKTVTNHYNKF